MGILASLNSEVLIVDCHICILLVLCSTAEAFRRLILRRSCPYNFVKMGDHQALFKAARIFIAMASVCDIYSYVPSVRTTSGSFLMCLLYRQPSSHHHVFK